MWHFGGQTCKCLVSFMSTPIYQEQGPKGPLTCISEYHPVGRTCSKSLIHMDRRKSLEYSQVFTALLCDVQTLHCNVFRTSDLRRTLNVVRRRISLEGLGFLTKTLPKLGKAFDKALADSAPLHASELAFKSRPGSQLPMLFGELFAQVLNNEGYVLPNADVACVSSLRDLCYSFYKLELPYDIKLEQNVIAKFKETERDVAAYHQIFTKIREDEETTNRTGLSGLRYGINHYGLPEWCFAVIRESRRSLNRLFLDFDQHDIHPRHGPGAVSTRERLWNKYRWTRISNRLTNVYPIDQYFVASLSHFCDELKVINNLDSCESSARYILVPKDSRGPRGISCEPVDFQWIQQGLSRAVVQHVERHPLTRESVRFTDQEPNRFGALYGSLRGGYATLDLNEASDRVSLGLVRLLFPEPLLTSLEACRTLSTELPDGEIIKLHKFAPMGSALCFPVLALTIWSLLDAGFRMLDADRSSNKTIYVYGDDVIVPTAKAELAMNILQSFGLKINRDKSCTKGFFRESCGMDAFRGICVTPVRFRTTWSSSRCPESYTSWIAYANSVYTKKYYRCYNYIVEKLLGLYGSIPSRDEVGYSAPALVNVPEQPTRLRVRTNKPLQKREYLVLVEKPCSVKYEMKGWDMLLRYFAETAPSLHLGHPSPRENLGGMPYGKPFAVRVYTKRKQSLLVRRWRSYGSKESNLVIG